MQIIRGVNNIRKIKNAVVALGVFDGVHLGHQRILKSAVGRARAIGGKSVAFTFWPHPRKAQTIYSLEHRLRLISELGIDVCIVVNFSKSFAEVPAQDFVRNILLKRIGAKEIFVGKNFRFGHLALGDVSLLAQMSGENNFRLKVFPVVKSGGIPVSSTHIRNLIKEGKLSTVQKLLGRPVSILGTVERGNALGRKIGFSTANINPHHEVLPLQGVYAVTLVLRGRKLYGICNIGNRPTIRALGLNKSGSELDQNIEVHLFDFKDKIYGIFLEVQFIKRIRNERKFSSLKELSAQIYNDSCAAKKLFFRITNAPQDVPALH